MSQYNTGSVIVANGSAIVQGVGTTWLTNAVAGQIMTIGSDTTWYEIASVDSDTQITLTTAYAGTTSDELVTNGAFAADTDWTKGTGWTISGGVAACSGAQVANTDLEQSISVSAGDIVSVTFTVTAYTAGNITPFVGGATGSSRSATGTFSDIITCGAGGAPQLELRGDVDFNGNIDDVSVVLAKSYGIHSSFTPLYNIPYPEPGDQYMTTIIKRALLVIEQQMSGETMYRGGTVLDKDLTTPPGTPSTGDTYLIAAGATGSWLGLDDYLATWTGTDWSYRAPEYGWRVWVLDENAIYYYDNSPDQWLIDPAITAATAAAVAQAAAEAAQVAAEAAQAAADADAVSTAADAAATAADAVSTAADAVSTAADAAAAAAALAAIEAKITVSTAAPSGGSDGDIWYTTAT